MRYRVSMPEPHSHLFHVELTLEAPGDAPVLALPVWTPGSYLVREFARHVEGLEARDGHGRALAATRLDKRRFRVDARGAQELVVKYRVYANELSVRTSHLDGTHGYWNGANLFFAVEGREREPVELAVEPPAGWRVATALEGGPTAFKARDYDELADSPVEVGTHEHAAFAVAGKRHELAVWGRGNLDLRRFTADVQKIVETEAALMGGLPYDRYLFIVHLTDKRRGGLEHASSCTLDVKRHDFAGDAYHETLALVAHEFFHLWNVKRMRPAALVPFDYSREQYTRLLWWFEGVTSYYDELVLARAGLADARRYLKHLGEQWTALERTPGARKASVEEASLTSWVKYYRPDENSGNSSVSYYLKGELLGLALDLVLRRHGKSLDQLMRLLFARHAAGGMPEDGPERGALELVGPAGAGAVRRFFDRHVGGVEPFEADLDVVGLARRARPAASFDDKGGTPPKVDPVRPAPGWLGVELAPGARLVVASAREGGPAWKAGLYAEDELVAESGFRVDKASLWERLVERGPGGAVTLTAFRRDELVEVAVPLAPQPDDTLWLEPAASPSEAQKVAFGSWCGQPMPAKP